MADYETFQHDVLVIGSGGAGLRAAIEASAAGVSVGCAGGGWRRLITGLREPHPEKQMHRAHRTQSSQRKKEIARNDCWLPGSPEKKAGFAGRDWAGIGSAEILKGLLAS